MIYPFFTLLASFAWAQPRQSINHTYLYWTDVDTSRTITVIHQSPLGTNSATLHLWSEEKAKIKKDPESKLTSQTKCYEELKRCIHEFKLLNLIPSSPYLFKVKSGEIWLTEQKKFKTLPTNATELTFVNGGDLSINENSKKLLLKAGTLSPDFILLGGDLAYDDGDLTQIGLWDTWLDRFEKSMVTKDGFMIPIISAIGNHEVKGGWRKSPSDSTMYLRFFRQNEDKTFFSRNISNLGLLVILDSGHIFSHEYQVPWLKNTLQDAKSSPFKIVAYHVPTYPSVRSESDEWVKEGRKYWTNVFDEFKVDLAFEHHDHALKRTHFLKNNKIDKTGVLYLGDGCMGKEPRIVKEAWYLEKAISKEHFWLGKIKKDEILMEAIGLDDQVLDKIVLKTKTH